MKQYDRELENNVYFWQKLDTLILAGRMETVRSGGQPSIDYPRLCYPLDLIRITDAVSASGVPLYGFRGTLKSPKATAIVVQADILAREVITRVLCGCTEAECHQVMQFINATEFQKAILVRRGQEIPDWSSEE